MSPISRSIFRVSFVTHVYIYCIFIVFCARLFCFFWFGYGGRLNSIVKQMIYCSVLIGQPNLEDGIFIQMTLKYCQQSCLLKTQFAVSIKRLAVIQIALYFFNFVIGACYFLVEIFQDV